MPHRERTVAGEWDEVRRGIPHEGATPALPTCAGVVGPTG